MSHKTKKRSSQAIEPVKVSSSSTKKIRKSSNKENSKNESLELKSSEDDSGFPSSSSSFNESQKKSKLQDQTPIRPKSAKGTSSTKVTQDKQPQDVNMMDVAQILALGEDKPDGDDSEMSVDLNGSDSEMSDWEEVRGTPEVKEPVIPKEGVNITLEIPDLHARRKKKGMDMEAHIKRQLNRVRRDMQLLTHKVHVLCWIAHLKFVNEVLNSQILMGLCLSLVTSNNLYPPKHADLSYLERIVKWFSKTIELKDNVKDDKCGSGLSEELCYQFTNKVAYTKKNLVLMFVVMLRTLGLKTRIVMSFRVVPLRPSLSELNDTKAKSDNKVKEEASEKPLAIDKKINVKNKKKEEGESSYFKGDKIDCLKQTKAGDNKNAKQGKGVKSNSSKNVRKKDNDADLSSGMSKKPQDKGSATQKKLKDESDSDESLSKHFQPISKKTRSKVQSNPKNDTIKNKKHPDADESQYFSESKTRKSSGVTTSGKKGAKSRSDLKQSRQSGKNLTTPKNIRPVKKGISDTVDSSDSENDFTPQSLSKIKAKKEIDRRILSSDEESKNVKKKQGADVWAEVFLEAEEKWISVDIPRQKIHCVNELHSKATQPVVYVIACNNDSTLKDVTKRYVPNWHSDTRKRRVEDSWWQETIWPYLPPKTAQDREEDEDINRQLEDKPLPSSISEYKDHPLYALKRHLLKFEGIYPPDAPTLGFVRGEPVYARECVVVLRSREIWFKEARVVRLKEEPYKIVKSRPKYDKMTGEFKKDLPLEVFGVWQTEEYIPPIAVGGKVPRNEYGNVDLFKPCMLPQGTVHLQIPALNRVAKKLGIDCAPAIVGFDFHSGGSHPVHDGFVVCEEFKEQLLDAWNKEIDESAKRNEEKRDKRIYGNWRRLIRGLLIREKLKVKYAFGDNSDEETSTFQATPSTSKPKRRTKK